MGRTGERAALRAVARWAGHPGTLVAVLVLLFNDHAGKRIWPGTLLAGKLSDLAWMLVAPVVVAFLLTPLLRLRGDRPALVGLAVTAVTFTVAKSGPAGGELASRIWSASGVPSRIEGDPTDLVALPLLAVSWWLWTRARVARRPWQWLAVAGVPLAVAAMVATSAAQGWSPMLWQDGSGAPVLDTSADRFTTRDGGATWILLKRDSADTPGWRMNRWKGGACVPADLRHCFRLLDATSPVEESEDGGSTWCEAFDPGPARRRWLPPPPAPPTDVTTPPWPPAPSPSPTVDRSLYPAELLVLTAPGGWAVLAHYPGSGLVRGDQDGIWELRPYPVRPPSPPSPPSDEPRRWPLGLPVAVVAGCAAVFAATGVRRVVTDRSDPARLGVVLALRQFLCLVWLLLAAWLCGGELLWSVPGVLAGSVLTLALLPILALVWRGPRPSVGAVLALGALGAVSGAAALAPYLLWGAGSIRTWSH
ncbi:hypothetical protein ABZ885_35485, partial [Kitasatospora sp. NPDC047058]